VVVCSSLLGISVAEKWLMSREKRGRLPTGSIRRRVTIRRTVPDYPIADQVLRNSLRVPIGWLASSSC
jgi:hypothetical protein